MLRRRIPGPAWLRPATRRAVHERLVRDVADRPLRWDESVRAALHPRAFTIGTATRRLLAAERHCLLVEPLAEPAFVQALARSGGP